MAHKLPENAVEMGQGLKADVIGDFADSPIWIEQKGLGFLDPHPRQIISKREAGGAFEKFAEIKCARVHRFRDGRETESVILVLRDEMFRFRDGRGLGGRVLDRDLVAQDGKVPPKNLQKPEHALIFFRRKHPGVEESFARLAQIDLHPPIDQFSGSLIKAKFVRRFEHDLAGLEKTDELIAYPDGHCAIGEPGETGHGARMFARFLGQLALHFEAGGADFVRARHQLAEGVFVRLASQGRLPMLHRPQRHRQPGGGGECPHIIPVDGRAGQLLDQLFVAQFHFPEMYWAPGEMSIRQAPRKQRSQIRA